MNSVMMTQALWILIAVQIAMGSFDMLYHHELTERLAWRPSQRYELLLHGIRNLTYAALFLVLAWFEPHGLFAWLVMALLVIEVIVTLLDFVEEDVSRKLPASERVNHTLLALNYGAILSLLLPVLAAWSRIGTGVVATWHGWWSVFCTLAAAGVVPFGLRDLFAMRRVARLRADSVEGLIEGLPPVQHVLVTGASGFIGRRLCAALSASGHEVIALLRHPAKADLLKPPYRLITSLDQIDDDTVIDAIVNLAGAPIASRPWTEANRRAFIASRLDMTKDLIRLVGRLKIRPSVLVSGSAIGWYGLRGDEALDESATAAPCFSHDLCAAWEAAAMEMRRLGVRVVLLRIGLVLGTEAGILSRLLTSFEFGLGGPLGDGRQWMSWIDRDDLVRLIGFVIGNRAIEGPLNATAPNPATNAEFTRTLAQALHRPAALRVPAKTLCWIAGDFARELLLGGQRIMPEKALGAGFVFRHPTLVETFDGLLGNHRAASMAGPAHTKREGAHSPRVEERRRLGSHYKSVSEPHHETAKMLD